MTARAAVQTLLETDVILLGIGLEAVYAANAIDTPPEQVFATVHWEEKTMAFEIRGPQTLVIWFHDHDRDYAKIDAMIARAITILEAAVHVPGVDGTLTTAKWRGTSEDLFDDGYNTVTKNVSFSVISR